MNSFLPAPDRPTEPISFLLQVRDYSFQIHNSLLSAPSLLKWSPLRYAAEPLLSCTKKEPPSKLRTGRSNSNHIRSSWGEGPANPNMSHPAKAAITKLPMSLSTSFRGENPKRYQ